MHGLLESVGHKINRFITARGIEWSNKKNLIIGLSEIVIYSGENRSLDFGYINPVSSHLEIELNNRLNNIGIGNANAVWQAHFDLMIKNKVRVSLNFLFDEFVFDPDIEIGQEHGKAVQKGLIEATNCKIILFDGDMEIHPKEINHLMILDNDKNLNCVFGNRFKRTTPLKSKWDFGNYFFTSIFNIIHKSSIEDSLCCAKAFFKNDVDPLKLKSTQFDIDIELASILIKKNNDIISIPIKYQRRTKKEGKKLSVYDGLSILKRIITFV